jgi:hypothetical protein
MNASTSSASAAPRRNSFSKSSATAGIAYSATSRPSATAGKPVRARRGQNAAMPATATSTVPPSGITVRAHSSTPR